MNSEKKLLSPKQRKGLGYLLLGLGIIKLLYFIDSTLRGETTVSLLPWLTLLIIGSVLLMKKNKD